MKLAKRYLFRATEKLIEMMALRREALEVTAAGNGISGDSVL